MVALLVSACGNQRHDVAFCDMRVERVEVFNTYGDHGLADRQEVLDPEDIAFNCEYVWSFEELQSRTFTPEELSQRATTVLVLHRADRTTRVVYVHQLEGMGTAIVTDADSYYLPNRNVPQYYEAESQPVDRAALP
ncbi:MAG: hypothetical protein JJT89_12730 [Nitriliruptoraceae bacterium]|nr:hypothetical protein [Nitriliruptoraceae bacterium]